VQTGLVPHIPVSVNHMRTTQTGLGQTLRSYTG